MGLSLLSVDNVAGGEERPVQVEGGVGGLVVQGHHRQGGGPHQAIVYDGPVAAASPSLLAFDRKFVHDGLILIVNNGFFVLWLLGQHIRDSIVATNTKHLMIMCSFDGSFYSNVFYFPHSVLPVSPWWTGNCRCHTDPSPRSPQMESP